MTSLLPPNSRRDFDVAIICALQIEADAAEALFDHFWDEDGDRYGKSRGDQNAYRTGVIGKHNVVLAYMPGIEKGHAASVAASFRSSFQGIRLTLIVGICGGVPDRTSDGVFLGDIVITDEIVVYDLGRRFPGGFRRKEGITNSTVNIEVRAFMQKLKSQKGREQLLKRTSHHFTGLRKRDLSYNGPGRLRDRLFENTYHHKHHSPSRCKKCEKDELCRKAQESTCEALNCDEKRLIARSRFPLDRLDIHFGRIASGDTVMKFAVERDRIAQEEDVIAFEMEGAGICNNLPFIMVKSVCDYADSHKDKNWQKYTAGRAAACMRSVLEQWAAIDPQGGSAGHQTDSLQAISDRLDTISEVTPPHPLLTEESHSSQQSQDNISEKLLQVLSAVTLRFKSVLASFKANRKRLPRDADLKSLLKTQRVVFLDILEAMSSTTLEPANTDHDSTNKLRLDGAQAIQTKLEEIEDMTNNLPITDKGKSHSRSDVDKLKDALEDLASIVQVFVSLIPHPKRPRLVETSRVASSLKSCREFKHFQIIQKAACSLYDAFGTACNAHTVHNVHLSLQPNLDQTLSRVQFNVAYSQISMSPGKTVWIKVESKIKSTEAILQETSLSMRDSPLELPVERPIKRSRSVSDTSTKFRKQVRFQFHSPPESLGSLCPKEIFPSVPNLHLQRNLCTLMKRISHQRECNEFIGSLGDNVILGHASLVLVVSVCEPDTTGADTWVAEDKRGEPRGGLRRKDVTTYHSSPLHHLAYIDSEPENKSISTSLSELISLSESRLAERMSFYEQIRLCRYLATAVLYYHATPWLKKPWRSDDIHFFGDGSSLQPMPDNLLNIAMATSVQREDVPIERQPQASNYHHVVRNPVLFGLGVMFLELAYEAPLKALQKPIDLEKGDMQGFADYFTAHRVADSNRKVTGSFKAIIKKCLHCDFGHDSDFTSSGLQEAFYHDVIGSLEQLEIKLQDI
ncbi:uncharacterized protein N7484_000400 [Penicillium longicatenatum]|uniref:uncharacterized protein n=1 Tax=Penicillium longicatenatum TaxID=1561947 RepID=UPI002548E692|nr:uncharacterized protein N7484_000400 [Penicillium longicatenatum]KAJ5661028.1 hypothetical protein N7484_000400 [Penicillium longicatenatum]